MIDTKALTGESVPRGCYSRKMKFLSGCINVNGLLNS